MIYEAYKKPINGKGTHPATHSWQLHLISDIQREEREGDETCYTSYVLSISSPSKYCN